MKKYKVKIDGMTCIACELHISKALESIEASNITVNYRQGFASFDLPDQTSTKLVKESINKNSYKVIHIDEEIEPKKGFSNQSFDFDLLIIGSGSAAFSAAIKASEYGAMVGMIERSTIGGTCVNVGCVPSKTLIRAGLIHDLSKNHLFEGLNTQANRPDMLKLVRQKDELVEKLRQKKYIDLLELYNIKLIQGEASFVDEDHISVNGVLYSAKKYLIATGASPFIPSIEGLDQVNYLTSTSLLELDKIPKSIAILGSGYVALELGQMLHHLGSKVTYLRRSQDLLKNYEPEISKKFESILTEQGITLYKNVSYNKIEEIDGVKKIHITIDGQQKTILSDEILVATGRKPNTQSLNLKVANVSIGEYNEVLINDFGMTSNESIYASGDVTNRLMFVYVAAYQGGIAIDNAIGHKNKKMKLNYVPSVIFTSPSIATVGYTEKEAKEKGYKVATSTIDLEVVPRALVNHDTRGLFKLVVDQETNKLLGVHILAEDAGEIIYAATIAVKHGLTIEDLKDTMVPYLTMSEGLKLAVLSFGKDISSLSCCAV